MDSLAVYDPLVLEEQLYISNTLFDLKPINFTGKDVESLSSYIVRLCNEHCIKVNSFFKEYILSNLKKENAEYKSTQINGFGVLPLVTVEILGKLTGRKELGNLTLLKFQGVLSKINLFKTYKTWCSSCFKEMNEKNEILYEKLIWNISGYEYCQTHLVRLIEHCPSCGKNQKILINIGRIGYCQHCNEWLGEINKIKLKNSKRLKELNYKSKQIEDLFDYLIRDSPINCNLVTFFKILVFKVSPAGLLELLDYKISYSGFNNYSLGQVALKIDILLELSWKLEICLVNIFTAKDVEESIDIYVNNTKQFKLFQKERDFGRFKGFLESALKRNEITPIDKLVKRLGTSGKTLRTYFPDLVDKIKEKNNILTSKNPKSNTKIYFNRNKDFESTLNFLTNYLKTSQYKTTEELAEELNTGTETLKKVFPDLYLKIKKKNKSIKENSKSLKVIIKEKYKPIEYDLVEKKLIRILKSIKEEPVYIKDIEVIIGISQGRLRRNFNNILKKINIKNKELIKRNNEKKYNESREILIKTIKDLVAKGVYPSVDIVDQELDFKINSPKFLKVWRETLNALGVKKKTFIK